MIKSNNIPKSKRSPSYGLAYHLRKTDNLRLRGKVRALVKIIPEKFNTEVKITKRRIWFMKDGKRFIQVIVGKQKLFIKIKTGKKWEELRVPDWEDFRRLYWILEK